MREEETHTHIRTRRRGDRRLRYERVTDSYEVERKVELHLELLLYEEFVKTLFSITRTVHLFMIS